MLCYIVEPAKETMYNRSPSGTTSTTTHTHTQLEAPTHMCVCVIDKSSHTTFYYARATKTSCERNLAHWTHTRDICRIHCGKYTHALLRGSFVCVCVY